MLDTIQRQGNLSVPEPHQLMNAWNLIWCPRRIIRGDEDYKKHTLYERDEHYAHGGLKLIGALYAIDRRDAWHAFSNKGLIDPTKDYEIL